MRIRLLTAWSPAVLGLLAGLCVIPRVALAQSRAPFVHERDIMTQLGGRVPEWSGGMLLGFDFDQSRTPLLYAVDRDGRREEIWLDLPGAESIFASSAAGGADGAIAVVGSAQSADSRRGHFLIWISPDRKRRTVIQLQPYCALRVAIAADRTIWAVGGLESDRPDETKSNILKHYDRTGKELASYHVRARARPAIWPDAASMSYLMASRDRVAWFTNGCEYIAFSFDGKEIERFDGPPGLDLKHVLGVALDEENNLVLGTRGAGGRLEVQELDRSSGTWRTASVTGPDTPRSGRILGFDGTALITDESGAMRRYTRPLREARAQ